MGYIQIVNPDGTIRETFGDTPDELVIEKIEICDMCNEPKPESDFIKIQLDPRYKQFYTGVTDNTIWECSICHAKNKS